MVAEGEEVPGPQGKAVPVKRTCGPSWIEEADLFLVFLTPVTVGRVKMTPTLRRGGDWEGVSSGAPHLRDGDDEWSGGGLKSKEENRSRPSSLSYHTPDSGFGSLVWCSSVAPTPYPDWTPVERVTHL